MADVLIYTNNNEVNGIAAMYQQYKDAVQAVLNAYSSTGLSALTTAEFPLLFTDTKSLIFDKVTGGEVSIAGVKLDKAKAIEIIAKPTGYDALITAIDQFEVKSRNGFIASDGSASFKTRKEQITQFVTLDGSGVLVYTTYTQTQISKAGKYYAKVDRSKAEFEFAQTVISKFFELDLEKYYHDKLGLHEAIGLIIDRIDPDAQTGTLNYKRLAGF